MGTVIYNNGLVPGQVNNNPYGQRPQQPGYLGPGGPLDCAPGDCAPSNCCAVITGMLLGTMGVVSLALGIALATYYTSWNGYAYAPLWAGILTLLVGIIGQSTCCCCGNTEIVRWLVLGFAGFCFIIVIIALVQVVTEGQRSSELELIDYSITNGEEAIFDSVRAMHTAASVFGGLTALTAFIGSLLLCFCVCCDDGPAAGPRIINLPNQQPNVLINQPPPAYNQGIVGLGNQGIIGVGNQGIIGNQGILGGGPNIVITEPPVFGNTIII